MLSTDTRWVETMTVQRVGATAVRPRWRHSWATLRPRWGTVWPRWGQRWGYGGATVAPRWRHGGDTAASTTVRQRLDCALLRDCVLNQLPWTTDGKVGCQGLGFRVCGRASPQPRRLDLRRVHFLSVRFATRSNAHSLRWSFQHV